MSPKPEEPVNDWHKVRNKKPVSWNGERTDVNPEESNFWGSKVLSSEEFDIEPLPVPNHKERPIFQDQATPKSRFEQNLINGICPHGIRWYHASTECINCSIKALQDEERQKMEAQPTIYVISDTRPPSPEAPSFNQDDSPRVRFFLTKKDAVPPFRAYEDDAGYDLTATEKFVIEPQTLAVVPTGVAFDIPRGFYGQIHPKSGLASKEELTTDGGVIDAGYKSEVKVLLRNCSKIRNVTIQKGQRCAQIVFHKIFQGPLEQIYYTPESHRGNQGFGSTGLFVVTPATKKITSTDHKEDANTNKHVYKLGEELTEHQKDQLRQLCQFNEDIFANNFQDIKGTKSKHFHDIDTGSAKPIKKRPYRIPYQYTDWLKIELQKMEENGIIRQSNSPWASPLIIVPKKGDGEEFSPRAVVDYRELNKWIVKDGYPMPRPDDILVSMGISPKYFSLMDLFSGFHQFWLTDEAIKRSAFVTPFGQWEYLKMPFGLCNAPTSFQRVMQDILRDLVGKVCFVYVDDISVFTATFEEHLDVLQEIFNRMRQNGLFLKPKKCTFANHEIKLLGFLVNQDGVSTDPSKIKAIQDFPKPTSKTEVRAFMGLANYYGHFVPNFASVSEKINKTLRKTNEPFVFPKEAKDAFRRVKQRLTKAPCLRRPDFTKEFALHTDACATGLGAILSQRNRRGEEVVISYASRATIGNEKNYGATDLELLAVVWATEHFKHYLLGRRFLLHTDHSALKDLLKSPKIAGMQARWVMKIQRFIINMVIKPGRKHGNADALSRSPHFIEPMPRRRLNLPESQ
jgi:deoxyuridine 5'-triphosphate nucleotidohydrolase